MLDRALGIDTHRPPRTDGEPGMHGRFIVEGDETWYRIDDVERSAPFFMALAGDSDLWAFVSSAGSLAAGRRDTEGSFLPYETVDKIHLRWEHTGPRSWILLDGANGRATVGAVRPAPWRAGAAALGVEEPVVHAHPFPRAACFRAPELPV